MEQSIRLRRVKLKAIRFMMYAIVATVAVAIVGLYVYQQAKPAQAAVNLAFSVVATHPEASAQVTASGKLIRDLGVIDGEIFMGYGDYGANTGPIHINPFNIASGEFEDSQLTVPTDALHTFRTINGKIYAPMFDPRLSWTADVGYAERANDGTWSNQFEAPAIHVFDMTTLDGDDLWMVGSSVEEDGTTRRGGTAYRSADGGTTWSIVMTDSSTPYNPSGLERYYWIAELDGSVYMQAWGTSPAAPVRSFDGNDWHSGTTARVCDTMQSNQVVVFADHIVCTSFSTGHIKIFDGVSIDNYDLPTSVNGVTRDFYVDDDYLYVLLTDKIIRTADLETWQDVSTAPNGAWSIAVVDDYVYLGNNEGQLLLSGSTITEALNTEFVPSAEKCFGFDSASGTITDYYDHQDDNPNNPACPRDVDIPSSIDGVDVVTIGYYAFMNNQLTSVVIPGSVTIIRGQAFSANQLTSVVIPDSVITIGDLSFSSNQLNSVIIDGQLESAGSEVFGYNHELISITYDDVIYDSGPTNQPSEECFVFESGEITSYSLSFDMLTDIVDKGTLCNELTGSIVIPDSIEGEAVVRIGSEAFFFHNLHAVHLPDSVVSIDNRAFTYQGYYDSDEYGDFGHIRYVRLYSDNPNIVDSAIVSRECVNEYYDENEDAWICAEYDDIHYGGHIVNPSQLTIDYKSSTAATISDRRNYTGKLGDSHLTNYLVTNGPYIPPSEDPFLVTPEEQQVIVDALSAYYRIGDEVTIDPIDIAGYSTPSAQSFLLANADNEGIYVYTANSNSSGDDADSPDDQVGLADTGFNGTLVAIIGLVVFTVGAVMSSVVVRVYRRS